MRQSLFLLLACAGCSLSIPDRIKDKYPKVTDANLQSLIAGCAQRLDDERDNASKQRDRGDSLIIIGGSLSGASGLTAAILAALSTNSSDNGEKIGAAITAGFGVVSTIVALLSKINESPAVPMQRRTIAQQHYIKGLKAIYSDPNLARTELIECAADFQSERIPTQQEIEKMKDAKPAETR